MHGRGWYQALADGDRRLCPEEEGSRRRREDLRPSPQGRIAPQAASNRSPMPVPTPTGELLRQSDPQRADRTVRIQALDAMARAGQIGWAEWAHRVREAYLQSSATAKADDVAEARAAAADARARAHEDRTQQRTDERER